MNKLLVITILILVNAGFLRANETESTSLPKEITHRAPAHWEHAQEMYSCGPKFLLIQKLLLEKNSRTKDIENSWQDFFDCIVKSRKEKRCC